MTNSARILVTGGASGIGAAVCRRLAGPETQILVHTRRNREGAEAVAAQLRDAGCDAAVETCDLAERGAGRQLVASAAARLGGLDILVANAGYALKTPLSDLDDADFDAAYATISRSFFELATAAAPFLKQSATPRIVAISAFGPHVWRPGVPAFPATSAAKAAVETVVRALALELAPYGIIVNAVAPGFVEKDAGAHRAMSAELLDSIRSQVPLGRIARPAEIAAVVAFCASRDVSYLTGQVIHVNGGLV